MGRTTDTRTRVKALAKELSSNGVTPTVALIRKTLGGGSPNTIVAALKEWRIEQESGPEPCEGPIPSPDTGLSSTRAPMLTATLLQEVVTALGVLRDSTEKYAVSAVQSVKGVEGLVQANNRISEAFEGVTAELNEIRNERQQLRASLDTIVSRFDAIQKHMLLSIETARAEGLSWKEKAKEQKEELATWRLSYQQKLNAAKEENDRLTDMLARLQAHRP